MARRLSRFVLALTSVLAASAAGCADPTPARGPGDEAGGPEQAIVERSAEAVRRMRASGDFPQLQAFLARARGVMVFPRLIKASLIFGGQGGNGVLVAKNPDGTWSDPAFYSLGAASAGLQIGYEEATVVLFFIDDAVFQRALTSAITLGTSSGVTVGDVTEAQRGEAEVLSKPVYQLVQVRGAFAGISLDGYVIGARNKHDYAYYGAPATPRDILIDHRYERASADVLAQALGSPPSSER